MAIHLGLDIGAVSLKLAALGRAEDRAVLAAAARKGSTFRLLESNGRPLVVSEYRRIAGSPIQATFDLLQEFYECVPEQEIEGIRITGSGSRTIARILGLCIENEFKAIARMVSSFYPQVRTIFEIGGESSKYLRLEPQPETGDCGIADYDRSGECAAGTGSFLDQQALRMNYSVEEVGAVAGAAGCAARIAGRCSVFAKSDMIHAQQKGYTPGEILRGLCDAVARNYKASVVKGRPVLPPVAFIGAVSQNSGVVRALREAFGLQEPELFVPELYAWCGAIGAALLEAGARRKRSFGDIHRLHQQEAESRPRDAVPLSMANVVLLRDRIVPYAPPPGNGPIPAYLGIDIGSVSTNLAAVDEFGQVIHDVYLRTAGRPIEAVQQGLREIRERWGHRLEIRGVGTTGSGRELIAELVGADVVNDEITAHKTGAMHVSTTLGRETVDTIFEIGGQDSKFIAIENGVVVDFAMNEACAAGTGSFLEEQAEKLGVSIQGEFARLALSAPAPTRLGERCTVFMERDLTAWLHKGETVPNLLAGLAYSIALNYLNRVVRGRRIGNVIYFQGGTAYNDAVAAAFAGLLGKKITVPPYNGVMGAIGMALIARQWHLATGARTKFRGYDLSRLEMKTRDFVCKGCSNHCDIKEFTIEGQKSYWGDKCSDRFRKPSATGRKPVIEDLFEFREKLVAELTADRATRGPRIGIPRAMSTFERQPFWHRYFTELGWEVVLSPPTDPKIAARGVELALAQPCYPVQVAHGHVAALAEMDVDYILAPNMLDAESEDDRVAHFCPWNQTLPFVLRTAPGLEEHAHKFLIPTMHFQLGREYVKKALAEVVRRLGVSRRASDRAVDAAYAVQRQFQDRLLEAGRQALETLDRWGEPGLILVGRGYNIYDRNVNCDIPRKLRHRYGANVIPIDFLVTGREPVNDLHPNMYWSSGRKILAVARLAASRPNLHLIYISNFKCGPDSYIKHFAREAAGAPYLVLQFDGHGNDAGYMTRCEAYLDSKGILRCYRSVGAAHAAGGPQ
ncbi:MAG: acyl-CoA dehydratase activase [Bryobacterales bacterium]|nr:acyl-CoA dehydratase activase [Bryobacteraceae bacterium]MDW8354956.1 acyl-CoA dehydratase activase [Bryobacterales bacterium]